MTAPNLRRLGRAKTHTVTARRQHLRIRSAAFGLILHVLAVCHLHGGLGTLARHTRAADDELAPSERVGHFCYLRMLRPALRGCSSPANTARSSIVHGSTKPSKRLAVAMLGSVDTAFAPPLTTDVPGEGGTLQQARTGEHSRKAEPKLRRGPIRTTQSVIFSCISPSCVPESYYSCKGTGRFTCIQVRDVIWLSRL